MLETKFSMAWRIRTIIQSSIEETITEFHPLGAFKLSFRENVTGSPDFLANNTKSPGTVDDDKIRDFLSELGMKDHVNHPNATKLIDYGIEGRVAGEGNSGEGMGGR
ncbi:hypothetical protein V6N13_054389 [Hibiscus sabdariffa]